MSLLTHLGLRRDPTPKKILMGVRHASKDELRRLISELDKRKPASVGLELREDYETAFSVVGFFGDLYTHLRQNDTRIHLLENPDLWNEYKAVELLTFVHEGSATIAGIQSDLRAIEDVLRKTSLYSAPECVIPLDKSRQRLVSALEINGTLSDSVSKRWRELVSLRSEYFIFRILATMPEIVIVGLGHAVEMKPKLKGKYTLECFSCEGYDSSKPRILDGHDLF
jgi:hypothetical protein